MKVCQGCGNAEKITTRSFIGRWKGQNIYEEWTECSLCGDTNFIELKPDWVCRDCGCAGMNDELIYDELEDECVCPKCESRRLYEV